MSHKSDWAGGGVGEGLGVDKGGWEVGVGVEPMHPIGSL